MSFQKKEIKDFIIATLVVALVFAFNDGAEKFEWSFWLTNYFTFVIIVAIALYINTIAKKLVSKKLGAVSTFKLWTMRRINLYKAGKVKGEIYIGIIIAIILTLFSQGDLFFPIVAITTASVALHKHKRAQRRYRQLTDIEIAKIHAAGPIASMILGLLLTPLRDVLFFSDLIKVTFLIGVLSLLPLPNLDGFALMFGSVVLYSFTIAFAVLTWPLSYFAGVFTTLSIAFIAALIFSLYVYHKSKAN